ncbi:MAG TPA: galactokinase family protein, partial [Bacteroidota bacterium]|nr:galactokinase family protein [Bacteroidota bacterium]
MQITTPTIAFSAPGRVCLFGEHQDYLGLPVVPCAISLRIRIEAARRSDMDVRIDCPDTGSREEFSLAGPLPYVRERDYFRSAVNVLRSEGFTFSRGLDCSVRGTIPINAGTSSSSALVVAWVNVLAAASDSERLLSEEESAKFAHRAEVLEFGEPGGMMDHCAAAYGGITTIDFAPAFAVQRQEVLLGDFVLGDSGEPKDTKGGLSRVKDRVLDAVRILSAHDAGFSLAQAEAGSIPRSVPGLGAGERNLLEGTIRNRDITRRARALLKAVPLDHRRIGTLLTEHQAVLRDVLGISTPKIDRMLESALRAGAFGGKINGSGGGGCMFAYAPGNAASVADAVR